jgi:hypothetical protein
LLSPQVLLRQKVNGSQAQNQQPSGVDPEGCCLVEP